MMISRTTLLSLTIATAICVVGALPGSAMAAPPDLVGAAPAPGDALARWAPVGPNGQAGVITQAVSSPNYAVLVPSFGVGPWVTDDAGANWRQLPDPPGVHNPNDANRVLIDPADPTHWWYAGTAATTSETVLLETHDGGRTWTESARFDGELLAFLRTFDESTTVLATATGRTTVAVHSRTDSAPWAVQEIDTGAEIRQILATDGVLILRGYFAMWRLDGLGNGSVPVEIYRVTDETRGAVNEALSEGLDPLRPSPAEAAENQIWAVANTTSRILVDELGRGLVGSDDNGATWTDWTVPFGVAGISSDRDAFYLVRSDPGARWVDITTDGGATFSEMRIPDDGAIKHQFTTWADGSITAANPRSGLYRTTDGGKGWERIGVQGTSGLDLLAHSGRLFTGTEYGLASTAVPVSNQEWGITGGEARVGTTVPELASAGADQLIWRAVNAAFNVLDVQSSADEGRTWDNRSALFGSATGLMAHPADPNIVVMAWSNGQQCGLRMSDDGGETWGTTLGDCFDTIVGDPGNPNRVWFGGPAGLFRSDDGGATGVKVSDIPATTILLDKQRLIVGGDELYTSEDEGATFTKSSPPAAAIAAGMRFTSLVRSGPRIFAGFTTGSNTAESGVLMSSDGGHTWTDFSTGIQNSEILSLELGLDGETLFAGTRNGGVHTTALPPRIAPTATPDHVYTRSGESVRIDVLANDSGGDLDIDAGTVVLRLRDDDAAEWTSSLDIAGQGAFDVDPATGTVVFAPEMAFIGTTGTVSYRFANTDGDVAEGELSVVVDAVTVPGGGDGGSSGSGDSGNTSDRIADTGVSALSYAVGALALLVAGAALALRGYIRRGGFPAVVANGSTTGNRLERVLRSFLARKQK